MRTAPNSLNIAAAAAAAALLLAAGCTRAPASDDLVVPEHYEFQSRFVDGSGVEHGEATAHHVLIKDIVDLVGSLDHLVDAKTPPFDDGASAGEVSALLRPLLDREGSVLAAAKIALTTTPRAVQKTYGDLAGSARSLMTMLQPRPDADARLAETWPAAAAAIGTNGAQITSVAALVDALVNALDANVAARDSRASPAEPAVALPSYISDSGVDLHALLASLLVGAVAYGEAAVNLLAGEASCADQKGICADNSAALAGDGRYTQLEHNWDAAFGYFGAAARFGVLARTALRFGPTFADQSADGAIDLLREYNYTPVVDAVRRDADSESPTQLAADAWLALRRGRALIVRAAAQPGAADRDALRVERDNLLGAWERVIAATVVHHINGALGASCPCGDSKFVYGAPGFNEHAAAWSAAKGYALALGFSPRARIGDAKLVELHRLLGDAPKHRVPGVSDAEVTRYEQDLRTARSLLGEAYGFAIENLGDEAGDGGW
ncbi:MAG: DUF4856 domain-containing protein [Myxococcales bacterium]|nr:DUF4856 domain-containing protein [Myxococcales bacterium]